MPFINIYIYIYINNINNICTSWQLYNGWTNITTLYIYLVKVWNLAFHGCKSIKSDDVSRYTFWVSDMIYSYKYLIWWLHTVICRISHMGTHIYVDIINGSKNFLQITRKLKLKLYRKEKIVQNDAIQHLLYIYYTLKFIKRELIEKIDILYINKYIYILFA